MSIDGTSVRKTVMLAIMPLAMLACVGCELFLPHKPCLIYRGDIRNAHGFGEIGRGGVLSPPPSVTYVFDPVLDVWLDSGRELILTASADSKAGITLVVECAKPGASIATRSTSDGSLRAWMVRDWEYFGNAMKSDAPLDRQPLLLAIAHQVDPHMAGVYPLVGSVEIRAKQGLPQHDGIDYLAFHLDTAHPVPADEEWPSETDTRANGPAWMKLRERPSGQRATSQVRGAFRMEQCLRLD